MKSLPGRAILSFLLFIFLVPTAFANHSWGTFHWPRQANPFQVKLGNNLSGSWGTYFKLALANWDTSNVIDPVGQPGSVNAKQCPIMGGRIEVCNGRYGQTGWLGMTNITTDGSHITGASVRLNDSYSMNQNMKAMIACHEVGHAMGLTHQDDSFSNAPLGTCLDLTPEASAAYNAQPNVHDFQQLDAIYNSHIDTLTSAAMIVSPEVTGSSFRDPRGWGRPIHFNKNGHAILFVREYRTGEVVFTHVFPAPEHHPGRPYFPESE